jgi:hypothetical protein
VSGRRNGSNYFRCLDILNAGDYKNVTDVFSRRLLPTFRRNLFNPSSGQKSTYVFVYTCDGKKKMKVKLSL